MAARAYGVIGLGTRAAKIKQVCSTRGGEREGERGRETKEREWRETEGGRGPTAKLLSGPKQLVENFPRSRCVLQKQLEIEKGGKKKGRERKCKKREAGKREQGERKEEEGKRRRKGVESFRQ